MRWHIAERYELPNDFRGKRANGHLRFVMPNSSTITWAVQDLSCPKLYADLFTSCHFSQKLHAWKRSGCCVIINRQRRDYKNYFSKNREIKMRKYFFKTLIYCIWLITVSSLLCNYIVAYTVISLHAFNFFFSSKYDRSHEWTNLAHHRYMWTTHTYVLCRVPNLPIAKHFRLSTRDSLYSRDLFTFALFNSGCNFPSDRSPLIFLDCAVGLRQFASCVLVDRDNERITLDSKKFRKFSTTRDSIASVYVRGI